MMRRFLGLSLAFCMLLALLPTGAVSAEERLSGRILQVSTADNTSAVIAADGSVWIWGYNVDGQLGDGTTTAYNSIPVKATTLTDVAAISFYNFHCAALKYDGSVWTWGFNYHGRLGDGTMTDRYSPVKVLEDATAVELGGAHSAAIKLDGSLWLWGWNKYGQLGNGDTDDRYTPAKLMDGVAAVSLGYSHSAAIKTDGSLWTWGDNDRGQLGDGSTTERHTPVRVLDHVAAVSLGSDFSAAIRTDGSLWLWGSNTYGRLGDGTTTDRSTPFKLMDDVAAVSLGCGHAAAIKTDGSLWTWGRNSHGQLGDGTTTDRSTPQKIMDDVAAVSLGYEYTTVIKTDGSLWLWGDNQRGQLGDGTTDDSPLPIRLTEGGPLPEGYYIRSMEPEFGPICINDSGTAIANYQVQDAAGEPVPGAPFTVMLEQDGEQQSCYQVTDGNGILSLVLTQIDSSRACRLRFESREGMRVFGAEQCFYIRVKDLSFTQSWSGELKAGGKVSLGSGGGGKTPAVKAEAKLLEASAKGSVGGKISVTDKHDDGSRTLTLNVQKKGTIGIELNSGVDIVKAGKSIELSCGAKAGVSGSEWHSRGLTIKDYSAENVGQQWELGSFLLKACLLENSYFDRLVLEALDIKLGNQSGAGVGVAASADVSLCDIKVSNDEVEVDASLAGWNGDAVWSFQYDYDGLDQTAEYTSSVVTECGFGFGGLEVKTKVPEGASGTNPFLDVDPGYILGRTISNHKEISALWDLDGEGEFLREFSYKSYRGDESDIRWDTYSTDEYAAVTYSGGAAKALYENNPALALFANGIHPFISIQDAIETLSGSGLTASFKETAETKRGFDYDFPIGLMLGIGVELNLGVAGEESYSYDYAEGAQYRGVTYLTSCSDLTDAEVRANTDSFSELAEAAVNTVLTDMRDRILSVFSNVAEGVKNAWATVTGAVSGWWGAVTRVDGGAKQRSFGVFTLRRVDDPLSSAAVCAVLGEPYAVAVFTDSTCMEAVPDEALEAQPLTLALEYTDEMLLAAGANPEDAVVMFWFDPESDVYVPVEGGVWDASARTVTAQITRQGEYLLAVDTAAPIVSDFDGDSSTTPKLRALVSDFSGIGQFRFWIDGEADLVTEANLEEYYDPVTDLFAFTVDAPLSEGTHTAYFLAADALGNAMSEPAAFEFEVKALRGSLGTPVPVADVISSEEPFTVSVTASEDNNFSQVVLQYSADGYGLESLKMERSGNVWTASVRPVPSAAQMTFTAVAGDDAGNTLRSPEVSVTLALPEYVSELCISEVSCAALGQSTVAAVTFRCPDGCRASGLAIAAAYDDHGRMLATGICPAGIASGSTTISIPLNVPSEQVSSVKAFYLDVSDWSPLCAPFKTLAY